MKFSNIPVYTNQTISPSLRRSAEVLGTNIREITELTKAQDHLHKIRVKLEVNISEYYSFNGGESAVHASIAQHPGLQVLVERLGVIRLMLKSCEDEVSSLERLFDDFASIPKQENITA